MSTINTSNQQSQTLVKAKEQSSSKDKPGLAPNQAAGSPTSEVPTSSASGSVEKNQEAQSGTIQKASRDQTQSDQSGTDEDKKEKDFPVVKEAIDKINAYMASLKRDLEFNFDEDNGRTIIKVIDKSTNEVVRVLPPEETLEIAERIEQGGKDLGAIIDLET